MLITGGAGFLGCHLTDLLLTQGIDVRVLDNFSTAPRQNIRPEVEVMAGDVRDRAAVDRAMHGVDRVVHLAAISAVDVAQNGWAEVSATNLGGTINVFEAACRARSGPACVIYASSAAVYGANLGKPLAEDAPVMPISRYGADKLDCEHQARIAFLSHGMPSVGLRIFNAFGPFPGRRRQYHGVIQQFCDQIGAGRAVTLRGDGQQTRDFVHVADVAQAMLRALERQDGAELYNVCTGVKTSILDLAIGIADLFGTELGINRVSARGDDIVRSVGSPERAARDLGFYAQVGLWEGLAQFRALEMLKPADRRPVPELSLDRA